MPVTRTDSKPCAGTASGGRGTRIFAFALLIGILGTTPGVAPRAAEVSLVTADWAPYYGVELDENGFVTALVTAAFERRGHSVSLDFMPWKRSLHRVEQGEADAVMGAYHSEERAQKYLFSDPFFTVTVGLAALPSLGIREYKSLEDLKPYRIGINRGWVNSREFDAADFLMKDEATHQILNVRKLLAGRVDMIVTALGVLRYEITQWSGPAPREIVFLHPPLARHGLHLMAARANPEATAIIRDFNQGLAHIREDGTYAKIIARFGHMEEDDTIIVAK